jgi:hypothetical protein
MLVVAILLRWTDLPNRLPGQNTGNAADREIETLTKLVRVDFLGATI